MERFTIILAALGICAVIIGGYFYPIYDMSERPLASATGTSFGTMKFSGKVISLASAGANGTSTSLYNSDSFTRYVTTVHTTCTDVGTSKTAYTGAGLANLTLRVSTSSTEAPATNSNGNWLAAINVATSSAYYQLASSTPGIATSSAWALWSSGSYMTFTFNATNTAACTVGVEYIGS